MSAKPDVYFQKVKQLKKTTIIRTMIRKPRPRKPNTMTGWFEILLRFQAIDLLKSLDDLDQDDYMMVGCRMPLEEYTSPHEVYTTLFDGGFLGMPRPLQEYDIISMVYRQDQFDKIRVVNLLLIDDAGEKNDHLIHPMARLQMLEGGWPLVLLPLSGTYIPSKYKE